MGRNSRSGFGGGLKNLALDKGVTYDNIKNRMKKILALTFLTLTLLGSLLVNSAFAAEEVEKQILPTSPVYLLVKIKESVQQFLTFNQSSKAELLENFAEQRIREMEYASLSDDDDALGASLDRYQAQKTQALGYVKGASDTKVMDQIKERTIEQQSTMTKMQLEVEGSEGVQKRIVEVQKEVAVETKRVVETVQGVDEANEMDNDMHYVWLDPNADANGDLPPLPDVVVKEWEYAPGTAGRDESGKMVEITYAPGTTAGGDAGGKMEIQWAPGTEGPGEGGIEYEGGSGVVVVEEDTGTGAGGGVKKMIIQQGTNVIAE